MAVIARRQDLTPKPEAASVFKKYGKGKPFDDKQRAILKKKNAQVTEQWSQLHGLSKSLDGQMELVETLRTDFK
ncbi:MAG: hypothetical protein AAF727_03615, partial [Pseudomonadota bacterium]